jgi:hypothetical protein
LEKDFEINIQDENVEDAPSVQLPMNFLTFGEIENDDVKVYIKQDVYKALEKLAASDTTKELGSIILGEYCQEHGKTHVIISQYIEAKYTDASASTLTFPSRRIPFLTCNICSGAAAFPSAPRHSIPSAWKIPAPSPAGPWPTGRNCWRWRSAKRRRPSPLPPSVRAFAACWSWPGTPWR